MNFKEYGKWLNWRYYTELCLKEMKGTEKQYSHDCRFPGPESNLSSPEQELEALSCGMMLSEREADHEALSPAEINFCGSI
jgi:hypothetical protein